MKMKSLIHVVCSLILLTACANTGTPGGGPKDETPPKLLRSVPEPNATHFNGKRVELVFDELVSLENVGQKVLISPPQKRSPSIKAIGNKIVVVFEDSLLMETTYTIDFTDAIVDYNEKNKFGDFAFSFSTGSVIDSLRVSGYLLDASNLNPLPGILTGLHDDLNDSAFVKTGFKRISRTNTDGFFSVKGLPSDSFRLFALDDRNRDYRFDQPGEAIAFHDRVLIPWSEPALRPDTVWKDSLTVDTVYQTPITRFRPDDVLLYYFFEDFGRQYLSKRERPAPERLGLYFGYKSETLPHLRLLNAEATDWFVLESNPTRDTLIYWITDSALIAMDTLQVELQYFKTDSTNQLQAQTDSLLLLARRKKTRVQSREKQEAAPKPIEIVHMGLRVQLSDPLDVYAKPSIVWETPVKRVEGNPWHLYKQVDTLWVHEPCAVEPDTIHLRTFHLLADWQYETSYKFEVDSGRVFDHYGKSNKGYSKTFKVRAAEEYSRLIVTIQGLEGPGFVELLGRTDQVVRRLRIVEGKADFQHVAPGTYYLRCIEDANGNGVWDTGNYADKRQPERVYYRPTSVQLRANWDVEETWNVQEFPVLEQKPKELYPKSKR